MSERISDKETQQRMEEIQQRGEIQVGGQTNINDDVIAAVAGMAAREVEGVAALGTSNITAGLAERMGMGGQRTRGISVEAGQKEAIINLSLRVHYGYSIPQVVQNVRKNVASRLLDICGLVTKEINVDVTGLEFPQQQTAGRTT